MSDPLPRRAADIPGTGGATGYDVVVVGVGNAALVAAPTAHDGGADNSDMRADDPLVGDLRLTEKMSRYSQRYALLVDAEGDRLVDEGEDEVWLVYAKTGKTIRAQSRASACLRPVPG